METFNDNLSPEELKMLTLQFMGQHLTGELKELDKNLISKTNTLKGADLNPHAVINSINNIIPQQHVPTQVSQPSQDVVITPAIQTVSAIQQQTVQQLAQPAVDQNQLEFSFETSPLSQRIFDSLERIERKLSLIDERLNDLEDTKKKD
jgi:hypothetical protein